MIVFVKVLFIIKHEITIIAMRVHEVTRYNKTTQVNEKSFTKLHGYTQQWNEHSKNIYAVFSCSIATIEGKREEDG